MALTKADLDSGINALNSANVSIGAIADAIRLADNLIDRVRQIRVEDLRNQLMSTITKVDEIVDNWQSKSSTWASLDQRASTLEEQATGLETKRLGQEKKASELAEWESQLQEREAALARDRSDFDLNQQLVLSIRKETANFKKAADQNQAAFQEAFGQRFDEFKMSTGSAVKAAVDAALAEAVKAKVSNTVAADRKQLADAREDSVTRQTALNLDMQALENARTAVSDRVEAKIVAYSASLAEAMANHGDLVVGQVRNAIQAHGNEILTDIETGFQAQEEFISTKVKNVIEKYGAVQPQPPALEAKVDQLIRLFEARVNVGETKRSGFEAEPSSRPRKVVLVNQSASGPSRFGISRSTVPVGDTDTRQDEPASEGSWVQGDDDDPIRHEIPCFDFSNVDWDAAKRERWLSKLRANYTVRTRKKEHMGSLRAEIEDYLNGNFKTKDHDPKGCFLSRMLKEGSMIDNSIRRDKCPTHKFKTVAQSEFCTYFERAEMGSQYRWVVGERTLGAKMD